MDARVGQMGVSYSARGIPTYHLELWHDGLNKHRIIKAESEYLVQQKKRLQLAEWSERWTDVSEKAKQRSMKAEGKRLQEERRLHAADQTTAATSELELLGTLLKATLSVDDRVDWESLKDRTPFPEACPLEETPPAAPVAPRTPREPQRGDSKYIPSLALFDRLIPSRKQRLFDAARALFEADLKAWKVESARLQEEHAVARRAHVATLSGIQDRHLVAMQGWNARRSDFLRQQGDGHATVDAKRAAYQNREPDAVVDYCELVLSASRYPDYFPQEFELEYDATAKTLVVDYQLPAPDSIPTLKAVRYVAARDATEETHITDAQRFKLYDDVLYQVVLRTIHELFESDTADALSAVVVNGIVSAIDRTTGKQATSCVLSVRANKAEFMGINLALVDPKACFKALKGVGSAKLSGLSPVAPIMKMRRDDGRFISAYEVAYTLNDGVNLAAMDWEDFEHLIREVFEKEFASTGGEVKVTQASRDGGVDAVAFDPDPIRGGKIVIQAKRWTNTVGVAAVRDLFGTVMAEGATKGVLVTTSDYGSDSYNFANGKPLVLLNGANLLHMLAKHGHKARIDIREARQAMHSGAAGEHGNIAGPPLIDV